ncbi:hypothetical protein GPL17_35965 [Bradyrhizobium yuanmingense]|nr:hypothetical protein [Bradyrhizobium yuanmingense]
MALLTGRPSLIGLRMLLRASDNHITLDETETLLLALERVGHVIADDADRLHAAYLRQRVK